MQKDSDGVDPPPPHPPQLNRKQAVDVIRCDSECKQGLTLFCAVLLNLIASSSIMRTASFPTKMQNNFKEIGESKVVSTHKFIFLSNVKRNVHCSQNEQNSNSHSGAEARMNQIRFMFDMLLQRSDLFSPALKHQFNNHGKAPCRYADLLFIQSIISLSATLSGNQVCIMLAHDSGRCHATQNTTRRSAEPDRPLLALSGPTLSGTGSVAYLTV